MSEPYARAPLAPELVPGAGTQWRRLSKRMRLVHPVIEVGRAVPAIAGALLAGGGSLGGSAWAVGIAVIVMGLAVTRWFTTTYVIGAEQIQVRRGLLRRRSTSARLDRVRTVDVTSHLLHRALGIARVVIGTGVSDRSGKDRLVLDGLAASDAAGLRAELLHRVSVPPVSALLASDTAAPVLPTSTGAAPVTEPDEVLARIDPRWLRYAPFTLSGALTGLAIIGVGWRVVSEGHVHLDRVSVLRKVGDRFAEWSPLTDVFVTTLSVVAFVAVASTVGYVLSFWGFLLARNPAGSLYVSRGLLTTRRTSIERRRLAGAELSEPLLLRWAGGARVLVIATGLRVGRGAERGGEVLLPPAPSSTATMLAEAVAGGAGAPFGASLTAHPASALRRRLIRAGLPAVLAVAVAALVVGFGGWSWWIVAAVALGAPASAALGIDRYRSLGHAAVAGRLVTRSGSLVRARSVLDTQAIIGWTFHASWFQRRMGLVTLVATTAAGRQRYPVEDLDATEAVGFADAVVPGLLAQFTQAATRAG